MAEKNLINQSILDKANKVFLENFSSDTHFERAIFLSWHCSKADCKFCFMSTLENKKKEAKRSRESILAEAVICKNVGWKIEFLSGGYDSYDFDDFVDLVRQIVEITGEKQWINVGILKEDELKKIYPYIEGFCGAIECVNKKIHDFVCPSKPIEKIEEVYSFCDKLELKKAMTLIIGLGESVDDFENLKSFVNKNKIDRITFYSLNPQKGTIFKKSPELDYYAEWIAKTRIDFPRLEIVAGAWIDKPEYFPLLLKAGANSITKIPAIKKFGTTEAKKIEAEIAAVGRKFKGTLTNLPDIDWDAQVEKLNLDKSMKEKIRMKLNQYLKQMRKLS